MRPRKKIECVAAEKFRVWFDKKFKGRRVLKTSYQFFNWVANGDDFVRQQFIDRFSKWCVKSRQAASWENAAKWFEDNNPL